MTTETIEPTRPVSAVEIARQATRPLVAEMQSLIKAVAAGEGIDPDQLAWCLGGLAISAEQFDMLVAVERRRVEARALLARRSEIHQKAADARAAVAIANDCLVKFQQEAHLKLLALKQSLCGARDAVVAAGEDRNLLENASRFLGDSMVNLEPGAVRTESIAALHRRAMGLPRFDLGDGPPASVYPLGLCRPFLPANQ